MAFATEELINETLSEALQILTVDEDDEDDEEKDDIACMLTERDRNAVRIAEVTNAREGNEINARENVDELATPARNKAKLRLPIIWSFPSSCIRMNLQSSTDWNCRRVMVPAISRSEGGGYFRQAQTPDLFSLVAKIK